MFLHIDILTFLSSNAKVHLEHRVTACEDLQEMEVMVQLIYKMEKEGKKTLPSPPRLRDAFATGFNTVTKNIYLIIFPVVFDCFLWFGPHIKVKNLFLPITEDFFNSLSTITAPETIQIVQASREMWMAVLERFNLSTLLHSYPVGIFSLMSAISPSKNPLGTPPTAEVTSFMQFLAVWAAFVLIGLVLGSLYFNQVARCCSQEEFLVSLKALGSQTIQAILLTLVIFLFLFLLAIPSSILLSVMTLINLLLAQGVLLLIFLVYIWLLLPLIFSPHGIFYYHQKVLSAILASARVVRFSLPATTMFFLLVVLLAQGLNMIWTIPPETSWMMLIGIAGHGFTSTALLASSFIFYRNIHQWLQENLRSLPAQPLNV